MFYSWNFATQMQKENQTRWTSAHRAENVASALGVKWVITNCVHSMFAQTIQVPDKAVSETVNLKIAYASVENLIS